MTHILVLNKTLLSSLKIIVIKLNSYEGIADPIASCDPASFYYLPRRTVVSQNRDIAKLHIVFDFLTHVNNENSLNECSRWIFQWIFQTFHVTTLHWENCHCSGCSAGLFFRLKWERIIETFFTTSFDVLSSNLSYLLLSFARDAFNLTCSWFLLNGTLYLSKLIEQLYNLCNSLYNSSA